MRIKKQEIFIINYLIKHGTITRNFCIKNYISRLGSYVCKLNKGSWKIKGQNFKGDYQYVVLKYPKGLHSSKK